MQFGLFGIAMGLGCFEREGEIGWLEGQEQDERGFEVLFEASEEKVGKVRDHEWIDDGENKFVCDFCDCKAFRPIPWLDDFVEYYPFGFRWKTTDIPKCVKLK